MPIALKTFNRRVPFLVRLLLVGLAGVCLYGCGQSALAAVVKFRGAAPDCTWPRTISFGFDLLRLNALRVTSRLRVSLKAQDSKLDLEQFSTGGRDFWIKRAEGDKKNGKEELIYLLSEHEWMASVN